MLIGLFLRYAGGKKPVPGPTMEKPRILIVEDESSITALLQTVLTTHGYCVCGAIATGEGVADVVRATHPDLVLMEVILDGRINGIMAAEDIQRVASIPIVFVSDFPDHFAKMQGLQQSGYITKPFKLKELLRVVGKALAGDNLPAPHLDS